jgi:hypothetical protein
MYFDKGEFKNAFGETVNAMTCYFIGDDYQNFLNALEDLLIRIKKVNKRDISTLKEEYGNYYDINDLIEKLEKAGDQKYTCFLTKLRSEVNSLQ